ncbi:MAG: hypothetical protein ACYTXA_33485 [Nostoc sp.]
MIIPPTDPEEAIADKITRNYIFPLSGCSDRLIILPAKVRMPN